MTAELHGIRRGEKICLPAFGQRTGENLRISPDLHNHFDSAGCFISAAPQTELRIVYTLSMSPLSSDRLWIASGLSSRNQGNTLAFPGESLFMERSISEQARTAATVCITSDDAELSIVSTLAHGTSCNPDSNCRICYESPDQSSLIRSYWTIGHQKIITAVSEKVSLVIAAAPEWRFPIQTFASEIMQIMDVYRSWMPTQTPHQITVFLFDAPFDTNYRHGFARSGGLILQMGARSSSDTSERRIILAHELFHLYNGEGLDYAQSDYGRTAWIREGMTQYLSLSALLNLSMIDKTQYYHWISSSIERSAAIGNTQLQAAERAYYRGFFLSLIIDLQWKRFGTPYTLQDFWRYLSESGNFDTPQTNKHILTSLISYSAFDFELFFDRYITHENEIPSAAILQSIGLCLYKEKRVSHDIGLEYETDVKDARMRVKSVSAESPAWQAGIRRGDTIVPAADTDWAGPSNKRLSVLRSGRWVQLRIPPMLTVSSGLHIAPCSEPKSAGNRDTQ